MKNLYPMFNLIYYKKGKIIVLVFLLIGLNSFSQTKDSITEPKMYKNSIKYNVTNMLLYDTSYQFSYERIIKENQSFTVFAGYQNLPYISLDLGDESKYTNNDSRNGYSIGGDYRFYLGSINKYSAPRGIYLAPFISYFNFETKREIQSTNKETGAVSTINLDSKLGLASLGGELGYQFVLWDRFVIDCILLGPSASYYKFNIKANGDIPGLDDNELAQKVIEALKDKFPSIGNITSPEGVTNDGVQSVTALGFRYSISIGYRF